MSTMASQITSLTIVYSSVYSGAYQRKHQSSASLAFVRGSHRWPVNSPHKGPVTRKMFLFDDVIMDLNTTVSLIEYTFVAKSYGLKIRLGPHKGHPTLATGIIEVNHQATSDFLYTLAYKLMFIPAAWINRWKSKHQCRFLEPVMFAILNTQCPTKASKIHFYCITFHHQ